MIAAQRSEKTSLKRQRIAPKLAHLRIALSIKKIQFWNTGLQDMEIGFTLEQAAGAAGQFNSAIGPTFWLILLVAVAGVGKLIFVAWGDRLSPSGLFDGLPGRALIGFAALLLVVGIFFTDREVRAWIKFKQNFVDPVIVDILGRDSCHPARNRFCVVTWEEDGREIIVNWYDRRIESPRVYRRPIASFHATISSTSRCA